VLDVPWALPIHAARRCRRWIAAGAVVIAVTATLAAGAEPTEASDHPNAAVVAVPTTVAQNQWAAVAQQAFTLASGAYDRAVAAGQPIASMYVAGEAWYAGQALGWSDPATLTWLDRLHNLKLPTGGYGLNATNGGRAATTTYSITTAYHVGRVLLDAYDHGAVHSDADVADAAMELLEITENAGGGCVDYSNSSIDTNTPCIYNISAASALFLYGVLQRNIAVPGHTSAEIQTKVTNWATYIRAHYKASKRSWDYALNSATPWEADHTAPISEAMYLIPTAMGGMGNQAVEDFMFNFADRQGAYNMTPFYCANADVVYPQTMSSLAGATTDDKKLALSKDVAYSAQRIQTLCGASPSGLYAGSARPMLVYPNVTAAYNNVGANNTANGTSYGFDGHGDTYDWNQLPAAGTEIHHGSLFIWSDIAAGQPDNILADGRVITMSTSGTRIGILGAVAGAATTFKVVVYYTDGSTTYATFTLPPWANSTRPTTQNLIRDTVGNYGHTGFDNPAVHYDIFYAEAGTASGKTIRAIAVPFSPTVHIFDAVPA